MRVLVVEDQERIASFIGKGLKEQGFVVDVSNDGDEGYALALTEPYDAIVLDVMLPGRDGLSILKNLRKKGFSVPVILLTARSELDERLEGLNLGADDYMTKPFYIEELIARLHTVVRRASGETSHLLKVADLSMNLVSRIVTRHDEEVMLSVREFSLLEYLMRSPGRVLSRMQICEHVWSYTFDPDTNLVDVYIQRLRKKIDREYSVKLIETVRGVGYRIGKPT
ncbi:MAG: response regulator transcription factor [Verrucomicrobiales bacterium]|jgi:DNA-binding response OmpR family regulator|nr:response regulator transcription factor [Verrucomicrobiales bacterium]MBP9223096.1 response regulator transcription factor [Verrucomicrobiales bacterium]